MSTTKKSAETQAQQSADTFTNAADMTGFAAMWQQAVHAQLERVQAGFTQLEALQKQGTERLVSLMDESTKLSRSAIEWATRTSGEARETTLKTFRSMAAMVPGA